MEDFLTRAGETQFRIKVGEMFLERAGLTGASFSKHEGEALCVGYDFYSTFEERKEAEKQIFDYHKKLQELGFSSTITKKYIETKTTISEVKIEVDMLGKIFLR